MMAVVKSNAYGHGLIEAAKFFTHCGVDWLGVDPGIFVSNIEKYLVPGDLYMGLIKALVFGFLLCTISCTQGFFASGGAKGVGEATTRAVVLSSVSVLIANYLLTSWLTNV